MLRSLICVSALVLVSACAPKSTPAASTPKPPQPAPAMAANQATDAIKWVRESAEYQAAFLQTYRLATARVEQLAPTRKPGTWAVVLDGDDTTISNSTYQLERARLGLGFSQESWTAWVRRREATAEPGAADFLSRVRSLGGKIAIVTNRLGSECDDTKAVFEKFALAYDAMLCRPDGTPSDKNARFEAVASGKPFNAAAPTEVVMFVGDNILDFPKLAQSVKGQGPAGFSEFGVKYFMLPNPMYGSWQ